MSCRQFKLTVSTVFILLIVSSVFQVSAATVWAEDFEDGNLDMWNLSHFTIDSMTEAHTQDNVSGFSVVNGTLTTPNTQDWYHPSRALYNSTVAYGTWSFDWAVTGGITHITHGGVLFIHTDRENNYNLTGLTQEEYYTGLSGYVLVLSTMMISWESGIIGPGLTIVKYTQQEPWGYEVLGNHQFSSTPIGSHHIDITRDSTGEFKVYFDYNAESNNKPIITVTDNSTTTSEKFGFKSFRGDAQFDNITVSDSVDVHPATASMPITVIVLGLMVLPLITQKRKKR